MSVIHTPTINHSVPIPPGISAEDVQVIRTIREITLKGNDVEVKLSKNGLLSVYAIKKSREI